MIARDDIIVIGRFNKPHGVNGEISASFSCEDEVLRAATCLIATIDGINVPFFVEAMRGKNGTTKLLTIDGIHNEKEAALLVNKDIFVLKSDYDKAAATISDDADELPVDYFIGFTAIVNGQPRGTISRIDDATLNVLFVVDTAQGNELLLPAVDDMIDDIDTRARTITMTVPHELLEL